jgi:hypothetical protein
MSSERGKPAETGKLTDQAARISPAAAVAGASLGGRHRVKPASPARAHTIQADYSLWRRAQRFYGNPLRWSRTYCANQSQTHHPNVIYQGQEFTIPQAGSSGASTSATSADPARANSPSSVTGYIRQTAHGTGLPGSVAAAQVQAESNCQAGAIFSAGAERPYRVMPSRWTGPGSPAGEEFNWDDIDERLHQLYETVPRLDLTGTFDRQWHQATQASLTGSPASDITIRSFQWQGREEAGIQSWYAWRLTLGEFCGTLPNN